MYAFGGSKHEDYSALSSLFAQRTSNPIHGRALIKPLHLKHIPIST